ncbi:hypothetical protein FJ656_24305 [Schumannella luteola]|uniref:Dihydroorotate dehydrogenase (Fumarate) n=1 Tax=Schumannella luteola TaxID=472059 RepID=A0A852YAH3_9MICO|nr:hypothetical protein [Schumannella luteola]NYG98852.1 dihydroorotate dehydrogenase (fumarate) [Schumannella luteola]TPX02065.1 hypothetical protein FJ656_24305 [Schumannella luteola]
MASYTVPTWTSAANPAARLAAAALALVAAATLLSVAPAVSARADDTIGISGAPAKAGAADGRTRFTYQVGPGQHLDDEYLVKNTGTTRQTVTVFGTDAFNTDDGSWGLLPTDDTAKDVGGWVTFGGQPRATLDLAPGESRAVAFAVDVPADAGPGDHAGGVVLSAVSPDGQVLVDRRVATRLYVRVPGDIQAALTVSSMKADYGYSWNPLDGTVKIDMTVKNTGNVALGGLAVVTLRTWFGFGLSSPEARPDFPELLPGNVRELSVTLHGVPALGYLEPTITLAPQISPDAIQPPSLVTTERSTSLAAVPWLLLAVLLVIGLVILVTRLRARADARRAEAWMAHVAEQARSEASSPRQSGAPEKLGADR